MAMNHRRANHASLEEAGLTPLGLLIKAKPEDQLNAIRELIKRRTTDELVSRLNTAQVSHNRIGGYLLSEELTERGIAPFFRRSDLAHPKSTPLLINEEYDQLVFDLLWIAKHYPTHPYSRRVNMERLYNERNYLFSVANSLFQLGNRPLWIITKKLKLTETQQWECQLLRSLPIKQKVYGLMQSAAKIYKTLADTMPKIMRTGINKATALEILHKRKQLWICAEMCNWSPTGTVRYFARMTGITLTKSHVANQLSKIMEFRRKKRPNYDEVKME